MRKSRKKFTFLKKWLQGGREGTQNCKNFQNPANYSKEPSGFLYYRVFFPHTCERCKPRLIRALFWEKIKHSRIHIIIQSSRILRYSVSSILYRLLSRWNIYKTIKIIIIIKKKLPSHPLHPHNYRAIYHLS